MSSQTSVPLWKRVDWSQLWLPGPTRRFSPQEMARAGGDRLGPTFWMVALVNLLLLATGPLAVAPPPVRLRAVALVLVGGAITAWMVVLLWRRPTRRRLFWLTLVGGLGGIPLSHVAGQGLEKGLRAWILGIELVVLLLTAMAIYAVAVYRAHQIEARLKELAERDEALALARRLSAAQLQPHFLFNTLASLQHWVDTGDRRAGETLRSLTAYLRALLPMFEKALHPLGDELDAMQRYLEVMQARLGDRLRFAVQRDPQAAAAALPPGLGLTLLENAVEHGVQPSLHGASITVRCHLEAGHAVLEIEDDGPGLAQPHHDGVGLRNCRQRLVQAHGAAARLLLQPADGGRGCVAQVWLPLPETKEGRTR